MNTFDAARDQRVDHGVDEPEILLRHVPEQAGGQLFHAGPRHPQLQRMQLAQHEKLDDDVNDPLAFVVEDFADIVGKRRGDEVVPGGAGFQPLPHHRPEPARSACLPEVAL